MARSSQHLPTPSSDEVVRAFLRASRAFVAIAARSLDAAGVDLTLPQYRTLVVLHYAGDRRTIDLARELGVNSSTATRMVDRLLRRGLASRDLRADDRRATWVRITPAGVAVVTQVMAHRRAEIQQIVSKVPASRRPDLVTALDILSDAAGEAPESQWSTGWHPDPA